MCLFILNQFLHIICLIWMHLVRPKVSVFPCLQIENASLLSSEADLQKASPPAPSPGSRWRVAGAAPAWELGEPAGASAPRRGRGCVWPSTPLLWRLTAGQRLSEVLRPRV